MFLRSAVGHDVDYPVTLYFCHKAFPIGYRGPMIRSEAEFLLRGQPVGTFLLRYSTNIKSYAVSYVSAEQQPQHIAQGQVYTPQQHMAYASAQPQHHQ